VGRTKGPHVARTRLDGEEGRQATLDPSRKRWKARPSPYNDTKALMQTMIDNGPILAMAVSRRG